MCLWALHFFESCRLYNLVNDMSVVETYINLLDIHVLLFICFGVIERIRQRAFSAITKGNSFQNYLQWPKGSWAGYIQNVCSLHFVAVCHCFCWSNPISVVVGYTIPSPVHSLVEACEHMVAKNAQKAELFVWMDHVKICQYVKIWKLRDYQMIIIFQYIIITCMILYIYSMLQTGECKCDLVWK